MAEQSGSQLLRCLPREIRDMIYGMVFEDNILDLDPDDDTWECLKPESTGLLLACKQTHAEAIDIYYGNLRVRTQSADNLECWLQNIAFEHVQHIFKIIHITIVSYDELSEIIENGENQEWHAKLLQNLEDLGITLEPEQLKVTFQDDGVGYVMPHSVTYPE